jgi:hypothetical protein
MAVAKCSIDHIKRSRFLSSADRVPVGVPAKERNVREKVPWGGPSGFCVHGQISNVCKMKFRVRSADATRSTESDVSYLYVTLKACRFGKDNYLSITQCDRLSTIGT